MYMFREREKDREKILLAYNFSKEVGCVSGNILQIHTTKDRQTIKQAVEYLPRFNAEEKEKKGKKREKSLIN